MRNAFFAGTSVVGLLREFKQEVKTFIKQELQLAKTELAEKLSEFGRDAVTVAIGGFIACAGVIVLLLGLGVLAAFAFERLGMEPLLAGAAGLGVVGLLIAGIGTVFVFKGVKTFSKQSLAPERTLETLRQLSGAQPEVKLELPEPKNKPTSKQLEQSVMVTEALMGETLDELGRRVSLRHARERAEEELQLHPYRWGLVAMGAGLAASFLVKRKLHRLLN